MVCGREGDAENEKWVWRVYDWRWGNEIQEQKVSCCCCCYGGVVGVSLSEGGREA